MAKPGSILLLVISLFLTGCATFMGAPYSSIPNRRGDAPSGSEFSSMILNMKEGKRESHILKEFRRGNIPSHLRDLREITLSQTIRGNKVEASIWVMPDYLAIGSSSNFIRIPMNPITAQRIADHYGFVLPTKKMVDQIYKQAELKLSPQPFRPGPHMVSTKQYIKHNNLIEKQLDSSSHGLILAGHKKDVVLSNRLLRKPRRVAIYGWHRKNGRAIQPLSTIHGNHYADYSHGIRLVAGTMTVNGREIPVAEVLQDKNLAPIISDEGVLRYTRIKTEGALRR